MLGSVGKFRWNVSLGLLVLLSAPLAAAQAGGGALAAPSLPMQPRDLHRAEVDGFSAPAPVAVESRIKCGPGGDIYAVYDTMSPRELTSAPIRRVSVSPRRITEYPVPAISGYENLLRSSFDVGADGTLYALLQANPQSALKSKSDHPVYVYLIVKYKDDGSMDSYFPLAEVPGKRFHPMTLAMFTNGNSLVSGDYREDIPIGTSLELFSAIFDQSGAFRAPVTLMRLAPSTESSAPPSAQGSVPAAERQGAIQLASSLRSVSSPDGNIYILQGDHIYAVSLMGSVEHEWKLMSPGKNLSLLQMASAGAGYLFTSYGHLSTGAPGENTLYRNMITVVNARTGEVTALYRMPQDDEDFAVAACAASLNDFLFIGSDKQNNLQVVHFRPN